MRHVWLIVAVALGGCGASSQAELEKTASHVQTFEFAENYQAIFRRVSISARRCLEEEFLLGGARLAVNAQLYNELGYGEITYHLSHALTPRHLISARIEKTEGGSRMTVRAEHANSARYMAAWAYGRPSEKGCI
jgi:hypothetical protein